MVAFEKKIHSRFTSGLTQVASIFSVFLFIFSFLDNKYWSVEPRVTNVISECIPRS